MTDADVLIVGAGISGLTIGWLLASKGVSVEVWEQSDRPGGKIHTRQRSGYLLEESASMVMNFRPEVTRFFTATDMDRYKIERAQTEHRYLLKDGRLIKLPLSMVAMVKSPVWCGADKLRMLLEPFAGRGNCDRETVSEFITRRLGRSVLEHAIEPFVAGPLASNPDHANAAATLPRLTALEQRYGSITLGMLANKFLRRRTATETEAFSFEGGMKTLIEALVNTSTIRLRTGYEATELVVANRLWTAIGASSSGAEHTLRVRHVVLCTPADTAAPLVTTLDEELGNLLSGIAYAPVSVVHMGFEESAVKHNLNGTGFLVPRREQLALTGCMWSSRLFPSHAPEGKVLLTNYLGGARQPDAIAWDDDQSVAEVLKTLEPLLGIKTDPQMVSITRHPHGLPLYNGAYPDRMRAIDSRLQGLPGLSLEANYRGGVSIRDRIVCAYQIVERILSSLNRSSKEFEKTRLPKPNGLISTSADAAVHGEL
jgi:oxygen-dependent protoporphyrinogen oxidase